MSHTPQYILDKYGSIIAEEVNVKNVWLLSWDQAITVQYAPIWSKLWASFWKDTWRIIAAAKKGQAQLQANNILLVNDGEASRELQPDQYEIRYSWFDEPNQIIEDGTMIELNLELNEGLINEGVAREISRFLNQMRKDADLNVSDRIQIEFASTHEPFKNIIKIHEEYLKNEALVTSFNQVETKSSGLYSASFDLEGETINFSILN